MTERRGCNLEKQPRQKIEDGMPECPSNKNRLEQLTAITKAMLGVAALTPGLGPAGYSGDLLACLTGEHPRKSPDASAKEPDQDTEE